MPDINIGEITEALNDKMDRDANNIESPKLPIFLVDVQYPTAENNYTWYRKYSDGWVEQGGKANGNNPTVVLPIEMRDSNYFISNSSIGAISNNYFVIGLSNITTTSFTAVWQGNNVSATGVLWEVKGMAAS